MRRREGESVQGVGPGSLLGGRYVVQRRVSQHTRFERWTAADQTLEREVVLLCFAAESPQAPAALDAARRAAGIEEARLVRVLDVGNNDGVAFVVEEPLTGARSLTSVLRDGGLPAEEARRVVGEAASALESARVRGLHHQVLTPRSVMRLEDGLIKVRGLATEAALLEAEESSSDSASRADTIALVALGYAALTGRWPLPGPDSGLEAAPRVVGGVAAPSEIAAGVPADLDLIARHTLNEDTGPLSPGDLAGQIAPWSPTPLGTPRTRQGGTGTRTEPLQRDPSTGGVAKAARLGRRPTTKNPTTKNPTGSAPAPGGARRSSGQTVLGMGVGGRDRAAQHNRGQLAGDRLEGDRLEGDRLEGSRLDEDQLEPDAPPGDRRATGGGAGRSAALAGAVATGAAAGTAAVAKGVGAAIGAAGTAAASVSSKVGGFARTAADRAAEKSASRAERRQTEGLTDELFDGRDVRLSETLEESDDEIGPPVPLLGAGRTEPLDRQQSKLALLLVGAFVLVAAILGVWGLPKLGAGTTSARTTAVATATTTATATPAAEPTTPAPTTAPPTPRPVAVVGGQAWDPEGDNQEGNASVPRAFDGKPDTMWRSQAYSSAAFGGFPKSGVGLVLDLGQQTDVHEVAVDLRGGADVTVYVASRLSLDGATAIGTSTGRDGTVTLQPQNGPVRGQLVIVWFTRLAPDGEGKFRAQVAEARVS